MLLLLCAALLLVGAEPDAKADLAAARQLLLTGKYEEAAEAFEKLAGDEPVAAALGRARAFVATGKREEAVKLLEAAREKDSKVAAIPAELAKLAFERGDYDSAKKEGDAALALDPNHALARWIAAELLRVKGELAEAQKAYRWFFDYYNKTRTIKDPEALYYCGEGIAQYARFTRNSRLFHDLINLVYPAALKLEKNYWPARVGAARLLLEKYNQAGATDELNSAIALNPNAAEAHAVRAALALQSYQLEAAKAAVEAGLEVNPNHLELHWRKADLLVADFRPSDAIAVLDVARKLNPLADETLGRLAACYGAVDGLKTDPAGTRMGRLIDEVVKRNERCGQFFFALAETLDRLRKYPFAAKYYDEAYRRMPQLAYVRGQLGLMLLRLGDEAKAAPLLKESFQVDPFNVRVKNTLEVLKVLETYAVLETDHFVLKFDRGQDELLAKYAARYLEEEVYPELVKSLGYEPKEKSLFEIFNRAKNTPGHSWFSTRMVGLPYVGTVGACGGKMVGMVSPAAMPAKFHWGRVLKHEFVHVVNLQQTDFNIPHWFTEGLAVWHEKLPRPSMWLTILAARLREEKLFNLTTINHGFIRPASSHEWTLAYCQAELYVEYMSQTYGDDAPAKMLAAYRDNVETAAAIKQCFQVEVKDFEAGYRKFVEQVVAESGFSSEKEAEPLKFAELQQKAEDEPLNSVIQGQLARAYLEREQHAQARTAALAAQKVNAKEPLAAYVLARLQILIGDTDEAAKILDAAHDERAPQEQVLALLAALRLKAEDYTGAAKLYEVGAARFKPADKWLKALAKVYLASKQEGQLAPILEKLVALDGDDPLITKKLAQMAMAKKDYAAAARWARETIHIDVLDAEAHALWGEAEAGRGKHKAACEEYEVAVGLQGDRPDWRFAWAQAALDQGEKEQARKVLKELLEKTPDYPGADLLLEGIDK